MQKRLISLRQRKQPADVPKKGLFKKASSFIRNGLRAQKPVGAIRIVDSSPLNWLWVLYNVAEELVRVTPHGKVRPAAMRSYRWLDNRTLEINLRKGEKFSNGQPMTASSVKRSFEETFRWKNPHPPGTQFAIDPCTRCEAKGKFTVRLHLPEPDGLALGKLRAYHIMSTQFWNELGFGYALNGSGEGHW